MRDLFNRPITYLRVSVTDKCNLRCRYCMPDEGIPLKSHGEMMSFELMTKVVEAGVGLGITKVRLTGGEPLVKKGILDLVSMLRAVRGLDLLCMTTNGTLLPRFAEGLKRAGLDSVNISLDTLNPRRYEHITRGGVMALVLSGIDAALRAGLPVKINTVVLPDATDEDITTLRRFCAEKGVKHQLIRHYSLTENKSADVSFQRPYACYECNRIRLLSDGVLKPCLHSDNEIPVNPDDPAESVRKAIEAKPEKGTVCLSRSMVQIGG